MTLSRQVAVYETGLIVYAVIGVGFAIGLYLWFRSVLGASDYVQNLLKNSKGRRISTEMFMATLAAALGAGWFMGVFALALARTANGWIGHSVEDEGHKTGLEDELERLRALFSNDDSATGILIAVVLSIRQSGANVTRNVLEKIVERWWAFLPPEPDEAEETVPVDVDAEFEEEAGPSPATVSDLPTVEHAVPVLASGLSSVLWSPSEQVLWVFVPERFKLVAVPADSGIRLEPVFVGLTLDIVPSRVAPAPEFEEGDDADR